MPETDDRHELARSLAAAVTTAIEEDWKQTKGPVAQVYVKENFSVVKQVSDLLAAVDRLTGLSATGVRPAGGRAPYSSAISRRMVSRDCAGVSAWTVTRSMMSWYSSTSARLSRYTALVSCSR